MLVSIVALLKGPFWNAVWHVICGVSVFNVYVASVCRCFVLKSGLHVASWHMSDHPVFLPGSLKFTLFHFSSWASLNCMYKYIKTLCFGLSKKIKLSFDQRLEWIWGSKFHALTLCWKLTSSSEWYQGCLFLDFAP